MALLTFLNQGHAGLCAHGFLKLILCGLLVCVHVSVLLITDKFAHSSLTQELKLYLCIHDIAIEHMMIICSYHNKFIIAIIV